MADDDGGPAAESEAPSSLAEQYFAANLRSVREARGLSQVKFAEEMSARGWPWRQQTVTRVETGRRAVRFGEAKAAAEILRTSLDRLSWSGAELTETAFVEEIAATLHREWNATAQAVARLHAAMSRGRRTLVSSRESKYERAREACVHLEAELEGHTLDTAIAEGISLYENPEAP